eukprot:UN07414
MEGNLLMTLGKERMPGLAAAQFNKPTDVVRDLGGRIYVSDGYGNSRVAVFDKNGVFIRDVGYIWCRPRRISCSSFNSNGR